MEGHLRKQEDFFRVRAPVGLIEGLVRAPAGSLAAVRNVVLDLQRRDRPARALSVDGDLIPVIPFPTANQNLVRLATSTGATCNRREGTVDVLLSRRTFDRVADTHGVPRITKLDVEAGAAVGDPVMRHLGACLDHVLDDTYRGGVIVVDRIVEALNLHIAQRYGGLGPAASAGHGGLAPWQLRRARNLLDGHLHGSVSLEELARECGLSTSHFSRAFARSTGVAPHRWLMRRRVELAKDLMLSPAMPLAQIALVCGFVDQSHFTRTFASIAGLTPGRWRASQAFGLQTGQELAVEPPAGDGLS